MDTQEIEIPVPWGVIRGKTWGAAYDPIVLLLHGLLDNAGTFDHLVPLLPTKRYYVSVDLPGHGFSSHTPPGLTIQFLDFLYVVTLITDYFNRDKYVIIGHSFGAMLGIHFGLLYPEKTAAVFLLDSLWCEIVEPGEFSKWIRNKLDETAKIKFAARRNLDLHVTYEEAFEITSSWRNANYELTHEATRTLLKRSIVKCNNEKFKFTKDLRLKNYISYPSSSRFISEVLTSSNLNFKVVCVLSRHIHDLYIKTTDLIENFKQIGTVIVVDEGAHHFHLNTPRVVAPIIKEFLE